jgi:hypothetical protein
MKNKLLLIIVILLTGLMSRAQISGTYSIPGATYPTVASAIAALNVAGVGPGGVTFNIAAGYAETFTSTTAGKITKGFGTASNPIVFQKSGTGANPVITAATPGTTTYDGIIILRGATYVTFNGINLLENPANVTIGTANALTEFGYAVLKAASDSASQHITIQNCAISLNYSTIIESYAVYQRHRTPENVSPPAPTTIAGTHSYNTYSGLTISNCTHGVWLSGYPASAPYTLYDQNTTVTGNTVTLMGASVSNLNYGYGVYVINTNNLTVTNNAINGTGSFGGLSGININGKAINVECSYNTFTCNYTGNNRVYGIYARDLSEGTTNLTNFHHNTVSGVTLVPPALAFYPMQFGVGAKFNIYDNTVTNSTVGSATVTSSTGYFGFSVFRQPLTSYSTEMNVYNNVFSGNNILSLTPHTANYQLLNLLDYNTAGNPAGPAMNVYNNTIENNSINSSGAIDCIHAWNNSSMKIHDNIIRNNVSWGQTNGIRLAGQKLDVVYEIYNNKVYGLTSNGTNASAQATGVNDQFQSSGKGIAYFYNNFISDLKAPLSISPDAVVGFHFATTNSTGYTNANYLYNNTVYLNAPATSGGPNGSSGVSSTFYKTLEMKNNIIVNTSAHTGSGKTVALKYLGTLNTSNYTSQSNNNLFYAGTPGPDNLIFADDANSDQTLTGFKTRVFPRDNLSVTELPPFANITTTPYDLHLQTTVLTQCESGGITVTTPVNINKDIDNNNRYPNSGYPANPSFPATAPDIGADEFGGIGVDVSPPGISFTPLQNTSLLTARTLTTSITDQTGVPTSGIGLPRLYWKINAGGSWNASTATWVSGTTYTFTLGSGVVLYDSVYYYIVAQDIAVPANVGSVPSTGAGYSVNPPACSTPPSNSSCFSYKVLQGMCGIINVGVGQTYATLTAALTALSQSSIACPVVFQLTDPTYPSETFPINVMNYESQGASAAKTITIRPAPGVNTTISSNVTGAIFKLTRSGYFIIDGSNNGSSSRNLTIMNTATTGTTAVIWVASNGYGQGTNGIVIKNCNIQNGYKTAGSLGIFVGSATALGASGYDNDNLTIENNALSFANIAINASCGDAVGLNDNLVIKNNTIGSVDPASCIASKGIVIEGASGAQLVGNEIYNFVSPTNGDVKMGIELKNNLTNPLIKENKIHDFTVTAGLAGASIGINVTSSGVANATIVNNLIYNLTTSNFNATNLTYNPFGIRLAGGTGLKLYHNTVRMTGTQASYGANTAGTLSSALLIMAASIADMKDNILTNDIVGLAGSRSYCIYMDENSSTPVITASDYNDFWPSGLYGKLGWYSPSFWTGIDCPTLAAWQAASGKDLNSKNVDPVFTSTTNLVPTTTLMPHAGIYFPAYPTDYANVIRTNPPDIGAYEFSLSPLVVTTAASGINPTTAVLNGTINPQGMTVQSYFDYGLTTAYGNSVAALPATVTGSTAVPVSLGITGLTPNTTYHYRARGVVNPGGLIVFGADQTFTTACIYPVITITGPASICSGTTGNVYTTQSGFSNYQWTVSAGGTITAGAGTNSITVTWNTAGAQTVSVNYTNVYGCAAVSPAVYNVTVNALPSPTISGSASGCLSTGNNNYSTQAGMSGYTWTVSSGGTITSGQGTNSIMVSWNSLGAQTVTVNYSNANGCSAINPTVFNVTVNALPVPTITGQNSICANSGYITYTTEAGMTGYIWTVSAGGTISAGQGTNVVSITWTTAGAQSVSVNYANANGCFALTPSTYAVTVNGLPGAAGTITGTATICGGAQGVAYSCAPIANASYYVWTLPTGATIASGAGTNVITVDFAANASSGDITVYGNNLCGNGATSPAFPVTVTAAAGGAGNITGQNAVCQGSSGVVYSVDPIANATSYTWTVPTGATIVAGQNTNSITVDFAMNAQSGNITVVGSNSCGNGIPSPNFPVTVNVIPNAPVVTANGDLLTSSAPAGNQWYFEGAMIPGATGQTHTATATGEYWSVVTLNGCSSDTSNHVYIVITGVNELLASGFWLYPVPNDGKFTAKLSSKSTGKVNISVYNNLGSKVYEETGIEVNGTMEKVIDLGPVAPGVYTVILENSGERVVKKMIVQ